MCNESAINGWNLGLLNQKHLIRKKWASLLIIACWAIANVSIIYIDNGMFFKTNGVVPKPTVRLGKQVHVKKAIQALIIYLFSYQP